MPFTSTHYPTRRLLCLWGSLLLWLLFSILSAPPAHADLGLQAGDFGGARVSGKKVSGKRVSGVGIKNPEDAGDNHGGSNGLPGNGSAPICRANIGNTEMEASGCADNNCQKTNSYVNLINREYQDDVIDLAVKAPGGFLKGEKGSGLPLTFSLPFRSSGKLRAILRFTDQFSTKPSAMSHKAHRLCLVAFLYST